MVSCAFCDSLFFIYQCSLLNVSCIISKKPLAMTCIVKSSSRPASTSVGFSSLLYLDIVQTWGQGIDQSTKFIIIIIIIIIIITIIIIIKERGRLLHDYGLGQNQSLFCNLESSTSMPQRLTYYEEKEQSRYGL